MSKYKIDKNVPMPLYSKKVKDELPFADMKPGDSFVCPKLLRNKITARTHYMKSSGIKVVTRQIDETNMRVWLVTAPKEK